MFTVTMITLRKGGRKLLMKNGYTFYRHKRFKFGMRWSCTNSSKCKSHLLVTNNGSLKKAFEEHNHKRPVYCIMSDGTYVKT